MYLTIIIIILILAFALIGALYHCARKLMTDQLKEKQKEADYLKQALQRVLPGITDGSVITAHINRVDLFMIFDEEMAKKAGMPTNVWGYNSFRQILHTDCMNVFEMWIFQYTQLHNPVVRRLRFHLTFDGGKTYQWWELIYWLNEDTVNDKWFDGLFVNIDKVKSIENAIEDAHKKVFEVEMKEALLATINHDLRTPLNAVSGFATLLTQQYEDFSDEERQEFSSIVCSNSESMLKLMDDIKSMSQDEIADKGFRPMRKSVSELMNFCYNTNRIICPPHLAFEFSTPVDVRDKDINVDSKRVERVINNFISNAFKFTAVGKVVLGWKYLAETKEVEIFVSDTGIGIAKENQDKVFEEYLKINEHAHGTGLGLNICKQIVKKHGGQIGLTSELGKGSTFYCRFKTI